LVVVAFLASSAIHNEKRSRRIVGVLSKSVSRMQYLLALLLGSAGFAAVYALAIDVSVLWSLGFSGSTVRFAAAFFCTFVSAAFWLAALALCLSTFMLPFLAATLSGAAGLLPLLSTYTPVTWSPVAALLKAATSSASSIQSLAIALAVLEAAVFVICGAAIFSRRDVTVSIE
jgi:ABC-type Na+ efflux pump permease subunit